MNPTREEALLAAVLSKSPTERGIFLDGACYGDPALRQRLEALLAAKEGSQEAVRQDAGVGAPQVQLSTMELTPTLLDATPLTEGPGTVIGRYKLLEQIGEGGFGVVYVAEQREPVKRRVALKIIKLGMDTKQVVARFEAERQALALMDHPNIAKVLDGGATTTGRPYFVMELVRGIPITQHCDQNNLSTEQRLRLFTQVCQAIQHAHQKGIIHRDIKPSNILVTANDGVAVPKVIDFGIAKATQGELTDKTVYTQLQQFIGTPAYMSPEQAEMSAQDIDTRSDIYSLGVLLYELLVGRTPFDAKELLQSGLDQMRQTIREKEPVRPSTRLGSLSNPERTTTAKRRGAEALRLISLLRGDLDSIAMKCLEKDRSRRYDTANGLALDVQRFMNSEPVVARPPSAAYKAQKFARRNKAMVCAAAAIATLLVLGIFATTWLAVRARTAEQAQSRLRSDAETQRRRAESGERSALRRAYASDMNLAQQALALNNLGRAQELLERYHPSHSTLNSNLLKDLCGWEWRYLWQQCHSDARFTLCQKSHEITALAISPDGQWLAVGEHEGGLVSVWNLHTKQELIRLVVQKGPVLAAFSPQGSLLAFSTTDGSIRNSQTNCLRLWNLNTREFEGNLPLGGPCRGLAFSVDGRTLVTSTIGEDAVVLWRIPDGQKLASFSAPQTSLDDGIYFAATRDLSRGAHATEDGQIRVIDLKSGQELWRAAPTDSFITALQFSPDGSILASGAGFAETVIRLHSAATGLEIAQLAGHRGYVHSLVFWPDGKTLASASSDQTIALWDLSNPERVPPPRFLRGHKREVWRLALLPDQTTLVSGSLDGAVNVWDTTKTPHPGEHVVLPAAFQNSWSWRIAPDSKSVLAVDGTGRVVQWGGNDFQRPRTLLELGPSTLGALLSADADRVIASTTAGFIQVWDLKERKLMSQFRAGNQSLELRQLLADDKRLLVHDWSNGNFFEWDLESQRQVRSFPGKPTSVEAAGLSADQRFFFLISSEQPSYLSDLRTEPAVQRLLDFYQPAAAAISPDGTVLAVASRTGYAQLYGTDNLRELGTLRGFLQGVHGIGFSADSSRLLTCSDEKETVKLWDLESQQELLTLSAKGSQFHSPAFSADYNVLAARNDQGLLFLWRAPSWEEIAAAEAKQKAAINQP